QVGLLRLHSSSRSPRFTHDAPPVPPPSPPPPPGPPPSPPPPPAPPPLLRAWVTASSSRAACSHPTSAPPLLAPSTRRPPPEPPPSPPPPAPPPAPPPPTPPPPVGRRASPIPFVSAIARCPRGFIVPATPMAAATAAHESKGADAAIFRSETLWSNDLNLQLLSRHDMRTAASTSTFCRSVPCVCNFAASNSTFCRSIPCA
ncbi:unnamed protein product, partial [Urochloa humidicola]